MKATIIVDDNGKKTRANIDMDQYTAMEPMLRLLAAVLRRNLARAFLGCVSTGIDVLVQEYSRAELERRKAELREVVFG